MEKMMIDDAIKKGQDAIWKLSIALENHAQWSSRLEILKIKETTIHDSNHHKSPFTG